MRKLALLALSGALWGACPAAAEQAREAWQAPTLSITRYDEDWSDLADAEKRAHHWTGPFKYIPINDDVWLSTGTEFRLRSESLSGNQWGGPAAKGSPDQTYLWARALPYADLHIGRVRAFVQPMASFATGVEPAAGAIDQSRLDLLQVFAEADLGPVTLRAGRQMVSLGTERLVGTRYGPNTPLAFDGARAVVRVGAASVNLLALNPVQPGARDFDDHTSPARGLWGAYAVLPGWDVYYLAYRNRNARFGGVSGRELRHSIGLRSHGVRGRFHWNVEGVAQFGHFDAQSIGAWTLGTEVGLTLPHAMDATMRVNIISGDGKAGDAHLGTFNALFPKGKYFGELSPVGPANIINLTPRFSAQITPKVSASVAAMAFWRYSRADGVYDIPGNLIRDAGAGRSRFIGGGAEAAVSWQATPELALSTSLSAFVPGAFLRETGSTHTFTMLGLEANFRF